MNSALQLSLYAALQIKYNQSEKGEDVLRAIIPELKSVISFLDNQEYLKKEIATNLDEKSQHNMYRIIKSLLADEIALVLEIEIRRNMIRKTNEVAGGILH